MNVDIDNFSAILPQCILDLQESDFLAIDLEMTGIFDSKNVIKLQDSCDTAYKKMRNVVNKFGIIQVGVCCMKKQLCNGEVTSSINGSNFSSSSSPSSSSPPIIYACKPYNFYVFPRPITVGNFRHNRYLGMCADAIHFNRKRQMDFGRWISKGIGFMDESSEESMDSTIRCEVTKQIEVKPEMMTSGDAANGVAGGGNVLLKRIAALLKSTLV